MTIARMTIARPQLQHQRLPTAGLQHRVVHVMTVLPIETLFFSQRLILLRFRLFFSARPALLVNHSAPTDGAGLRRR